MDDVNWCYIIDVNWRSLMLIDVHWCALGFMLSSISVVYQIACLSGILSGNRCWMAMIISTPSAPTVPQGGDWSSGSRAHMLRGSDLHRSAAPPFASPVRVHGASNPQQTSESSGGDFPTWSCLGCYLLRWYCKAKTTYIDIIYRYTHHASCCSLGDTRMFIQLDLDKKRLAPSNHYGFPANSTASGWWRNIWNSVP